MIIETTWCEVALEEIRGKNYTDTVLSYMKVEHFNLPMAM